MGVLSGSTIAFVIQPVEGSLWDLYRVRYSLT